MRFVHVLRLAALSVATSSAIAACSPLTTAATGGTPITAPSVTALSSPTPGASSTPAASATATASPTPNALSTATAFPAPGASATPTIAPATPTPTPSPTPTAPPAGVLSVNPLAVTLNAVGDTQVVTVQETGYAGAFSETNTCGGSPVVATFSTSSGTGPTWTPTITATNAGTCSALYIDANGQQIPETITVNSTGFTIQSARRTR